MPGIAGVGLGFNQFLIDADQPLLFHCGPRSLFAAVSAAAARIIDINRLRWITFSHVEADECGSMNDWLAPRRMRWPRTVALAVTSGSMTPRRARRATRRWRTPGPWWQDGSTHRHASSSALLGRWPPLYEESTSTLFCSDLLHSRDNSPAVTSADVVGPAIMVEKMLPFTSLTPTAGPTVRRLAALQPRTLAIMHGASFVGDGAQALETLAGYYEERLRNSIS